MIIKSLRHTSPSFKHIVDYLFDGMAEHKDQRWIEFRNISHGFDKVSISQEFERNTKPLKNRRSLNRKMVYKYHEILGFSKDSSPHLTNKKLRRIANEYFSLRDPGAEALGLCVPHFEKGKHIHLHLLFSSNYFGSDRSSDMRMNNTQYYEIRRKMERFMLQNYPELHHSVVYLKEKEIEQLLPEKYHNKRTKTKPVKRFHKQSKKKQVADIVVKLLEKSSLLDEFLMNINKQKDFEVYYRNDKPCGVIYKRTKYRFKTLGIEQFRETLKVLERMNELKAIEASRKSIGGKDLER